MLGAITDEIMFSYGIAIGTTDWRVKHIGVLRDALRDQLAAKLKAEFAAEHYQIFHSVLRTHYCAGCGKGIEIRSDVIDPRHENTDEQWLAEADRILRGDT